MQNDSKMYSSLKHILVGEIGHWILGTVRNIQIRKLCTEFFEANIFDLLSFGWVFECKIVGEIVFNDKNQPFSNDNKTGTISGDYPMGPKLLQKSTGQFGTFRGLSKLTKLQLSMNKYIDNMFESKILDHFNYSIP